MKPLCCPALTLLCTLSFLPSVLSLQCNETQYGWPQRHPESCCNKCSPGTRLSSRCSVTDQTLCAPCEKNRYSDTYNLKLACNYCETCDRPNMEYKIHCNATHNAVCVCKDGYECRNSPCKQCSLILSTAKPTAPPVTTALKPVTVTSLWIPRRPLKDTTWFLVIIALLSAGIIFVVVTKIQPFLHWIRSKHGNLLAKSHTPASSCSEEEEVSKPVQEAGKTDPELGLTTIYLSAIV